MTEAKKKQFTELKEMHPDTLLLFRCGDFYESYQEDAESASRILGITLTRDKAGFVFLFPACCLSVVCHLIFRFARLIV